MNERGFGLMQVLIALLVISVVALGLLNVRARTTLASVQADQRASAAYVLATQARSTARFSQAQKDSYISTHERLLSAAGASDTPNQAYQKATQTSSCYQAACTGSAIAEQAAMQAARAASEAGIFVKAQMCHGRLCLLAAWGASALSLLDADCPVSTARGECLRLEGY